tara:strand:- start:16134 stop:16634 length:501 start_codon:yes stop_codon:yes gene_type:complete
VIIGGHRRDAAGPAGQSFNGLIDYVRIYDEVFESEQIFAAMIPNGRTSLAGLRFTDISFDSGDEAVSLTFTSKPGRFYSLPWSPDLLGGPEFIGIDDSVQGAAEGNLITISFPAPRLNDDPGNPTFQKAFFLLRENLRRDFYLMVEGSFLQPVFVSNGEITEFRHT